MEYSMSTLTSPQMGVAEGERTITRPDMLDDPCIPDCVRILRLLEANDGQLWQGDVVEHLDVSKATVSRRLAELEDEDEVDRMLFRGKNLVWLSDNTPDILGNSTPPA